MPQHIWQSVGDPGKFLNASPVGTGPYKLQSVSASGAVLTANPDYWGGPFGGKGPAVKTVQFPSLASNTSALTVLLNGSVQWSGNFIPGFQKAVGNKPIVNNSPPGNTNSFEPNLSEWPTNQLAVRQAISLALDRTAIGTQGESGQELPVTNASGLPLPVFTPYLSPSVKHMTFSPHANVAAANKVLKDAGYKKVGKYWSLNGKQVKLTITDPSGFSDYKADDILAAQELQKAGINATFLGQGTNQWFADIATGNFQLMQHWSPNGRQPGPVVQRLAQLGGRDQDQSGRQLRGAQGPEGRRDAGEGPVDSPGSGPDQGARPAREVRRHRPADHPDRVWRHLGPVQRGRLQRVAGLIGFRAVRDRAAERANQRGGHSAPHAQELGDTPWGPNFGGHVAAKVTPPPWGPNFGGHVAAKVTPGGLGATGSRPPLSSSLLWRGTAPVLDSRFFRTARRTL